VLSFFAVFELIGRLYNIAKISLSKRGKEIRKRAKEIEARMSRPGNPFSSAIKLRWRINKRIDAEGNINKLFQDIMNHMGLSHILLQLHIFHSRLNSYEAIYSYAGQYQPIQHGASKVELMLRADYRFYHIAAILAHECAHHLLFQLQIANGSAVEYELRTDIAAIYAGFGRIMEKGYAGTSDIGFAKANRGLIRTLRLGYINEDEIRFARFLAGIFKLKKIILSRS
jgi:hypothetical protein